MKKKWVKIHKKLELFNHHFQTISNSAHRKLPGQEPLNPKGNVPNSGNSQAEKEAASTRKTKLLKEKVDLLIPSPLWSQEREVSTRAQFGVALKKRPTWEKRRRPPLKRAEAASQSLSYSKNPFPKRGAKKERAANVGRRSSR